MRKIGLEGSGPHIEGQKILNGAGVQEFNIFFAYLQAIANNLSRF